jgi:hypothetical protein
MRIFYILIILLFCSLSGCSECNDDTCGYHAEKSAVWSEDDEKLALVIDELGENKTKSDNSYYLYTVDLGGSNFEKILEIQASISLLFYNIKNQYLILRQVNSSGVKSFYQIDLTQKTSSLIVSTEGEACLDYKVIPSLDGDHIAIVKFQGSEAPTPRAISSRSISSAPYAATSVYSSKFCSGLTLEVDFIDSLTGTIVGQASSLNPYIPFMIYFDGNIIDMDLDATWTQSGLIIPNYDVINMSSGYAHVGLDGAASEYSTTLECGQHETSSGLYAKDGTGASVIGFEGASEAKVILIENEADGNLVCLPL